MAYKCFLANRPHLGQARIALDLGAPALVVGQVPVQHVEFVERQDVDIGLDFVNREDMAAAVQVGTAVSERGLVLNLHPRDAVRTCCAQLRNNLHERLSTIEQTGLGTAPQQYLPATGVQHVLLVAESAADACLKVGFSRFRQENPFAAACD